MPFPLPLQPACFCIIYLPSNCICFLFLHSSLFSLLPLCLYIFIFFINKYIIFLLCHFFSSHLIDREIKLCRRDVKRRKSNKKKAGWEFLINPIVKASSEEWLVCSRGLEQLLLPAIDDPTPAGSFRLRPRQIQHKTLFFLSLSKVAL